MKPKEKKTKINISDKDLCRFLICELMNSSNGRSLVQYLEMKFKYAEESIGKYKNELKKYHQKKNFVSLTYSLKDKKYIVE